MLKKDKEAILLVSMPYADTFRPSLSLGLLQAALTRRGFKAKSIYANCLFMEFALEHDYFDAWHFAVQARFLDLVGEWSFSQMLFPEQEDNTPIFANTLLQSYWIYREKGKDFLLKNLTDVRKAASAFLNLLAEEILMKAPQIVGCSSTFEQHCASLALLKKIKETNPEIVTILGGANCETIMGMTTHKHFPWVDFVVSGEGDEVIVPLVERILQKGTSLTPREIPFGVFGPVHRTEAYPEGPNGELPRASVRDLNQLPTPDFDDYFETIEGLTEIKKFISPGLLYESSRGCWWGEKGGGCTFCGLNGRNNGYRSKSPKKVIHDLELIAERYRMKNFEMVDNIFDRNYFSALLPLLKKKGAPFKIFYETKSNLTQEQIKAMKEAGIGWIQPGIESLNTALLRLMNKGCTAWQNLRTLKWCRQHGTRIQWFILWEFPGEQDAWYGEMARVIPKITHYQPPVCMLSVVFNRYSYYHENTEKLNLKITPLKSYYHIYPFSEDVIEDLAYFFENDAHERIKQDPFLSRLTTGNGITGLRRELLTWWKYEKKNPAPMLIMTEKADVLHLKDTRPIATQSTYQLTGAMREIYLASEDPVSLEILKEKMLQRSIQPREFDEAISYLKENHLVIFIDGRVMALALRAPVPPLPTLNTWPGGCSRV